MKLKHRVKSDSSAVQVQTNHNKQIGQVQFDLKFVPGLGFDPPQMSQQTLVKPSQELNSKPSQLSFWIYLCWFLQPRQHKLREEMDTCPEKQEDELLRSKAINHDAVLR